MKRFFFGVFVGVVLTVEGVVFGGVGHGSYAPLTLAATLFAFFPLVALAAGPLLWAIYFLLIPSLDSAWQRITALLVVLAIHVIPSFSLASQDPAFARISLQALSIVLVSFLIAIGSLMFVTLRKQ